MLVSYSHRFIFVHIYKVAGTSIRIALANYTQANLFNRLMRKSVNKIGLGRNQYIFHKWKTLPGHLTAMEIRKELSPNVYDHFFKFAFVRNPWDWQVSLYHYTLQTPEHHQHELIKSMSGFEEYIEWRVTKDRQFQKKFVTDIEGNLIVDFIGKYENIALDFDRICRFLKIQVSLPHINQSSHRDYRSYYNHKTRDLIEIFFKEDIDFFGYEFDPKPVPVMDTSVYMTPVSQ